MLFAFGPKLKMILRESELQKDYIRTLEAELALMRQMLEEEKIERREVTNLIFARLGFVVPSGSSKPEGELRPIGRGVQSWNVIKQKLEHNSRATPANYSKWAAKAEEASKEIGNLIEKEEQNAN